MSTLSVSHVRVHQPSHRDTKHLHRPRSFHLHSGKSCVPHILPHMHPYLHRWNWARSQASIWWAFAKHTQQYSCVCCGTIPPPPPPGVLPENFGRGVRHASQNPYPIYDQNLRFSLPYLWPDQKFDTLFMTLLLDLTRSEENVTVFGYFMT